MRSNMAVAAYVLLKTEVGRAGDVLEQVRRMEGIVSADGVTGPYDIIVRAEVDSMEDLGRMVVRKIQQIDGISGTLTCPVVSI